MFAAATATRERRRLMSFAEHVGQRKRSILGGAMGGALGGGMGGIGSLGGTAQGVGVERGGGMRCRGA